ncbi:MAG TPA: Mrp/NBP35 family ATP-binding protein [Spirochaetota bacterium]|nr:Mrp/NBP35 family ATP-binding protein [Spirochaetota bacterium]HOM11059.1 Mrp/NBP35 family ATP-binding protein [Spirochaetota bacterium]
MFGKGKDGSKAQAVKPGMDSKQVTEINEELKLQENLNKIKHTILVLSGKGGVGKSTVATNLAVALASRKFKTGLLDIDIHGPSVPTLLGIEKAPLHATDHNTIVPVQYNDFLKVISEGLMLPDTKEAVIWRGPLKYNLIKQFLSDVEWGELDYLVIDSPPGTGDEPLSVAQLVKNPTGAVIVTTPQNVSTIDVKKSITFCHKLNIPVLGVVENMSGFVCPHCGKETYIFRKGGGSEIATEMDVPFLGTIPLDPLIVENSDAGRPFAQSAAVNATVSQKHFEAIVTALLQSIKSKEA